MRIAVAVDGEIIAAHFGRCEKYLIYDIECSNIISKKVIPNPGHTPGFLPQFLHDMGVNCLIAGGMGIRAQELFSRRGIDVVLGANGPADRAVDNFIKGKLKPGVYENTCSRGEDHDCSHHPGEKKK
ncbi:MAG: Dinitrogenase iron-molybdenum cofactor biosynthesis [Clostridia bacterium 41_269]|nr:MAG: Dinitrogenase iron-molybdenum cofactor biosynthesis [Clostridia bacterium 41_269]